MFKYLLVIFLLFPFNNLLSQEDSINKFVYEYLKRINEHIEDEDFVEAQRELDIFVRRYFVNEQSYERALINQLYGNFYAIQGMYEEAIPWYLKSLKFKKMPLITGNQVRVNLSQCYFQLGNYEQTIVVLEEFKSAAEKRRLLFPPTYRIMLGISYFQENEFIKAYENISKANQLSTTYKEDWLGYQLSLAIQLEEYDDATEVAQLLFLKL